MSTAVETTERLNDAMNPEVKAKWLAALRSGEYKQGEGRLRRIAKHLFRKGRKSEKAERFCCLGVLCDLYIKETGKGRWDFQSEDGVFNFTDSHGRNNSGMPTEEVYEWAGMQHRDLISMDESDRKKFRDSDGDPRRDFYYSEQNDEGRTFKTIANVIEKYL